MQFVQDNAELAVKKPIAILTDGEFSYEMDNGAKIQVKITIDRQNYHATIDFTGTSEQLTSNFNEPLAVTQAAVLYVFHKQDNKFSSLKKISLLTDFFTFIG